MPSPIGHAIAGYMIYKAVSKTNQVQQWKRIVLYLFAANVPDLDFIPGLIIGDPNRYHHGATHSIGFALIFASDETYETNRSINIDKQATEIKQTTQAGSKQLNLFTMTTPCFMDTDVWKGKASS